MWADGTYPIYSQLTPAGWFTLKPAWTSYAVMNANVWRMYINTYLMGNVCERETTNAGGHRKLYMKYANSIYLC